MENFSLVNGQTGYALWVRVLGTQPITGGKVPNNRDKNMTFDSKFDYRRESEYIYYYI